MLWRKKEDMPADLRLLVGSLKEREEEAKRQCVFECWETHSRRNETKEMT
jgi:hypothetical protein